MPQKDNIKEGGFLTKMFGAGAKSKPSPKFDEQQHGSGLFHEGSQSRGEGDVFSRVRQINFAAAFIRMFYTSRYNIHMEEIVLLSKDKFDPSQAILPVSDNSTMELSFDLPRVTIQVFEGGKFLMNEGLIGNAMQSNILLHFVIEHLSMHM